MGKKAIASIGTLFLFIAGMLIAVVAAAVLLQSSNSFSESATSTGGQAKNQIATNIRIVEISGTEGSDGSLDDFTMIAKLAPGSGEIQLSKLLLSVSTHDKSISLNYRGVQALHALNSTDGFYTFREIDVLGYVNSTSNLTLSGVDLNEDGQDDRLLMQTATNSLVYVFNSSSIAPSNSRVLGTCDSAGQLTENLGTSLGFIDSLDQTGAVCLAEDSFFADASNTLTILPVNASNGWYTVDYLQRGTNPVDGNFQNGDFVKFFFSAPRSIHEDEVVRVGLVPKTGTGTRVEFHAPEVMSQERVYVYPE